MQFGIQWSQIYAVLFEFCALRKHIIQAESKFIENQTNCKITELKMREKQEVQEVL